MFLDIKGINYTDYSFRRGVATLAKVGRVVEGGNTTNYWEDGSQIGGQTRRILAALKLFVRLIWPRGSQIGRSALLPVGWVLGHHTPFL